MDGNYIGRCRLTLDEFQEATRRTRGDDNIAVLALGIAGEAGEVAEHVKKYLGHGHELDRVKVAKELFDVQWYCARLADSIGLKLSEVADLGFAKLKARYPEKFESKLSINRSEE